MSAFGGKADIAEGCSKVRVCGHLSPSFVMADEGVADTVSVYRRRRTRNLTANLMIAARKPVIRLIPTDAKEKRASWQRRGSSKAESRCGKCHSANLRAAP